MPNWCDNKLHVFGPGSSLYRFWKENEDAPYSDLSLEKSYPVPKEFKADSNMSCQWCSDNWGTKWNVSAELDVTKFCKREMTYYFQSAWAPPVGWLEYIAPKYPELDFSLEFEEGGMNFKGYVMIEKGKVREHIEPCYS